MSKTENLGAANQPVHVLHVIASAPYGGAESVVRMLAQGQNERSRVAAVLALLDRNGADDDFVASLRASGIEVMVERTRRRAYGKQLRGIVQWIRRLQPNIVHCHGYRGIVLGLLAAKITKTTIVATVHGYSGGDLKNRLYEFLDQRSLRYMDGVMAVSEHIRDQLSKAGVGGDILQVVPNALAIRGEQSREGSRARLGFRERGCLIGWVGRLSHEKGVDIFIRALAEINRVDIHAMVIGDGPERKGAEQLVREYGMSSRVTFAGAVGNAGALMSAFDALVLSSRTEGTPITLLEAMGNGVPVIATAVGDVPRILEGGRFGTLVASPNPAELAAAITDVFDNLASANRRAMAAREHVIASYSKERWIDHVDSVYNEAMSGSG